MRLAGSVKGQRVLGLGFATPYLRFTLQSAERVLAFMPARQGASAWPREGPSHTVLCDPLNRLNRARIKRNRTTQKAMFRAFPTKSLLNVPKPGKTGAALAPKIEISRPCSMR